MFEKPHKCEKVNPKYINEMTQIMDTWDYFLTIHSQNKRIFKIKDDVS